MRRILVALKKLPIDIEDVHAYGGIVLMSVGAGLWHVELGLVIAGVCLFGLAVAPHLKDHRRR